MKTTGFIGPSGTGKSHRASWVANERGIEYILDDGLLVKGNRVMAGTSAKKQSTRLASIRHALFYDEAQREEMIRSIKRINPESILIIGTSDGMVDKIVSNLGLPEISERIYITDVANEFEIQQAINTRREQGKHVIPVPTFEIKKDFSGYFLDPLQIFKRKARGTYQLIGEKSVVRPTFSYMGSYTISDYAIYQIVEYVLKDVKGVSRITRFRAENHPTGIYIEMDLSMVFGYKIREVLDEVRLKIRTEVERLTALNISSISITVKSLQYAAGANANKEADG